jgi:pyridoxal phosphate enzyme (YggS family)
MDSAEARIRENLQRIRTEVAEAAAARGRDAASVRLVAVTKSVGLPEMLALAALGQRDFGENRVEQLARRAAEPALRHFQPDWHMIGHVQRRKVRDLLPLVALVHGVDSVRLAEEIHHRAEAAALAPAPVLLEVNVSGEEQKFGLRPEETLEAARHVAALGHVDLRGLMTMAPLVDDPELARPVFRGLRELRDRINDARATPQPLVELSMGMSQDYRVAVEEGATLIRVGTALFA